MILLLSYFMIINLFMNNLIRRCWIGSEDSMGSVLSLPVTYLRVFQSYSALWHHYISEFMIFPYLQLHSDDRIVLVWFFPPSNNCYEEFLLWLKGEIWIAYTVNSFTFCEFFHLPLYTDYVPKVHTCIFTKYINFIIKIIINSWN